MTAAETLAVDLGDRSYDIVIGGGLLAEAGARLKPLLRGDRAVVVADETVAGLHGGALKAGLEKAGLTLNLLTVPAGEATKSFDQLQNLITRLADLKVERRDVVIAFGGGVVGDLTGFAAAVLRRGCGFAQIPTTLLAQVDSSVGGKTGINIPQGKNLVGAFHQPQIVLADTDVLDTLPKRELLAGYAEVVKYGLLGDAVFFEWLEANGDKVVGGDAAARIHAVKTSCAAKAAIVAEDEREAGKRALLNLGHTFGHALEAETGYSDRLLHGEGVAIGMALAFDFSVHLGLCKGQDAERAKAHMAAVGLPTRVPDIEGPSMTADALVAHMAQDKKVVDGKLTFILARRIGEAFITQQAGAEDVRAFLETEVKT